MENLIPDFYAKKSILRKWLYSVMFYDARFTNSIKPHHVVDISIPFYAFEANSTSYGAITKSFTTLQKDRGLAFSITLEDDRFGAVTKLIHVLQRTILNENGVYNILSSQLLDNIRVTISDDSGKDIMAFTFVSCRFVGADDFSLSYSDSESLKHKINFICDVCKYEYLLAEEESNPSEVPKMHRHPNRHGHAPSNPIKKLMDDRASDVMTKVQAQASSVAPTAVTGDSTIPSASPTSNSNSVAGKLSSFVASNKSKATDAISKGSGDALKSVTSKIPVAVMGAASAATAIPGVSNAVANVTAKLGSARDTAQSSVNGAVSSAMSRITPVINNAESRVGNARDSVTAKVNNIESRVGDARASVTAKVNDAKTLGSEAASSVSSRVSSALGSGGGKAQSAVNTATSSIKTGFSKLKLF